MNDSMLSLIDEVFGVNILASLRADLAVPYDLPIPADELTLCPACLAGDHEGAHLYEGECKCECACHNKGVTK